MTLPCASAERSRLLPEVFDDCSYDGHRLSPRDKAIIRKMNESVFVSKLFETGGIGLSESREKVVIPYCPPTWHHFHFVVSAL